MYYGFCYHINTEDKLAFPQIQLFAEPVPIERRLSQ